MYLHSDFQVIEAKYDEKSDHTPYGLDIHPGWNMPPGESSTGCLTILDKNYFDFMSATGLDQNMKIKNSYESKNLKSEQELITITGAMVVDRSLADLKDLLTMYGDMDTVNIIMGK